MHTATVTLGNTDDLLMRRARRRVKLKMGFFIHALVFTLVHLGLFALHAVTGGERGPHLPIWGWALGLSIHGTVVLSLLLFNTQGLREQLIAREVERLQARS